MTKYAVLYTNEKDQFIAFNGDTYTTTDYAQAEALLTNEHFVQYNPRLIIIPDVGGSTLSPGSVRARKNSAEDSD